MAIYSIELNYNARITKTVEASDEGDALEKARTLAEDADMKEFAITEELVSRVVNTR
jgi:hypothetical protein